MNHEISVFYFPTLVSFLAKINCDIILTSPIKSRGREFPMAIQVAPPICKGLDKVKSIFYKQNV